MKKYPRIVQADSRGQIVIPKEIRNELSLTEGTGFYIYTIEDEGILLKKIPIAPLKAHDSVVVELEEKSEKVGMSKTSIRKSVSRYGTQPIGKLEDI